MSDARYLGKNPGVQSSFKALNALLKYALLLDYAKANPIAPVNVNSDEFKRANEDIDPMFKRFLENYQKREDMKMFSLLSARTWDWYCTVKRSFQTSEPVLSQVL